MEFLLPKDIQSTRRKKKKKEEEKKKGGEGEKETEKEVTNCLNRQSDEGSKTVSFSQSELNVPWD